MNNKKENLTARKDRATATPDALLGVLSMAPMSGYTMRSVIEESIGNFWSESYGQIYPALKRLAAEGLVEKKTERQKGRPARYVYSLTEEGWERLREWLAIPARAEVPRNDLLLKLFFGTHAPAGANRENVAAFVALHEEALARYAEIARDLKRRKKEDPRADFWQMTLSYGRHHSTAMVAWGRETLKELDVIERAAGKAAVKRDKA
jgi:DNA-binding PadR family transcriptional regulator